MKSKIIIFFIIFFPVIILALTMRGIPGNPTERDLSEVKWTDEGPFELSPERGRFALTFSLIENKSFHFSVPIARFAIPDLGYQNGNYVSLFAPGVSFVIIPGYLLGKLVGLSQVGSFVVISLFAILNIFLIRAIAVKLKANPLAATLGSLTFLFATPAFTYAVTLYQHHLSTFLILLSIYALLRWNNLWSCALVWFLAALAIPIDYPNLFLMLPVGIYALGRIISFERLSHSFVLKLKLAGSLTFLAVVVPLAFFLWFNQVSYGNPFQLSGTIKSVKAIDESGNPAVSEKISKELLGRLEAEDIPKKKTATTFFNPRNLLNGFYIHFISPDRGVIWFTPVIFFSILGMFYLYRRNQKILTLLLGIIGVNIVLYSMWGDPWGGWAFGSRYLIPSYAIAAILVAFALTAYGKRILFVVLFLLVMGYSVVVNTAGALSTSQNPPQVEILNLEKLSGHQEKYTYARNLDFLASNRSKSFLWQIWGRRFVSAFDYFRILSAVIILTSWSMAIILWIRGRKEKDYV